MRNHWLRPHRLAWSILALLLSGALLGGCATDSSLVTQTPSAPASIAATAGLATEATPSSRPNAKPLTTVASKPASPTTGNARRDPHLYPDARLTPGAVLSVTAAQVSVAGYSSKVRNVPASEKRAVYAEYHLAYPQKAGAYECDHFIPLCLGGSNSTQNLWPEPAPQFHWKDGLEVYLWHEVREHTVSLSEAQREIRVDWYAYWVKAGKPGSAADADSAAARPAPIAAATSSGGTIVGWSVSGARYHYLSCRYFLQIKPVNRRTGTIAQARAAGKTPCKVCQPPG
jgi:hypothetical protein